MAAFLKPKRKIFGTASNGPNSPIAIKQHHSPLRKATTARRSKINNITNPNSPTRLMTNLLSQVSVTSPGSNKWAKKRRQSDLTDLIWHRPFLVDNCHTTVSLPDETHIIVECKPTCGPYSTAAATSMAVPVTMDDDGEEEESTPKPPEQSWSFCIECDDKS